MCLWSLDAASLFQVRLLISSIFSLWKRTIFHECYKHEDGEIKSTFWKDRKIGKQEHTKYVYIQRLFSCPSPFTGNIGSGKKRTFAISDFKHYDVRATEKTGPSMKDMLVTIVATSLRVKTVNPITRELPGGYSKSQGQTGTHHSKRSLYFLFTVVSGC